MGGFQVPLGVLAETHNDDALWAIVKDSVEARVARVIPDLSPKRKESPGNSD
jgi:hypothetical protein